MHASMKLVKKILTIYDTAYYECFFPLFCPCLKNNWYIKALVSHKVKRLLRKEKILRNKLICKSINYWPFLGFDCVMLFL